MRDYVIGPMGTTGTLELRGNALRRWQEARTAAAGRRRVRALR